MYKIKYLFNLDDGSRKEFEVRLDPETITVLVPQNAPKPDWTRLDFHQCPGCPLSADKTPHCPIAVNIAGLVHEFKEILSAEKAYVVVQTDERSVSKHTPIAEGLYSLLGIYMAASGCPNMDKLKPMAAHHLPFSTIEETVYRVMTMYLAAQYFKMKNGLIPDWELKELTDMYETIRLVNQGFAERIRSAAQKDAVINSIVNLDVFAMVLLDVPSNVNSLEYLFKPFFRSAASERTQKDVV